MQADNYAEWETELGRARLGVSPADLHGSITGFLCAGWGGKAPELLAALALEGGGAALDALLDRAAAGVAARFRAGQPVDILLPPGSVATRANAAVDWCRGLLGGLGLTGVVEDHATDSATRGILRDLAEIASHPIDAGEDDAAALAEVLRFVRDGVQQLHATFAPAEDP